MCTELVANWERPFLIDGGSTVQLLWPVQVGNTRGTSSREVTEKQGKISLENQSNAMQGV